LKAVKVIRDPEAFQILADETRRKIIYLLRAKEMTVSQIAHELGLTAQAIYHHIRKLKKAGMVDIAREERIDHFIETYYEASAEVFQLSHGEGKPPKSSEEQTKEAIKALATIGMDIRTDPESISKAVSIVNRMDDCCGKSKWEDKVTAYEGADFFVKQAMHELSAMLSEGSEQIEERFKLQKELMALLKPKAKRDKAKS